MLWLPWLSLQLNSADLSWPNLEYMLVLANGTLAINASFILGGAASLEEPSSLWKSFLFLAAPVCQVQKYYFKHVVAYFIQSKINMKTLVCVFISSPCKGKTNKSSVRNGLKFKHIVPMQML